MKAILLLISLQVSAGTLTAQQVTLHLKNATLWQTLSVIQKQTGIPYLYNQAIADLARPVTIDVDSVAVAKALEQIFSKQVIDFKITGDHIVLMPKPLVREKPEKKSIEKQTTPIRGKVKNTKGEPLPGVTIRVRGTNMGTTSDADGNFSLDCGPSAYLLFSYVGFQSYELAIAGKQDIQVILEELAGQLEEMVVKGYYNTTKELNTGNVTSIKGEVLNRQPVGDPLIALQGNIPGLSIAQTSGIPGSEVRVQLRGQNSIANGNDPLYIVDGVPFTAQSMYAGLIFGGKSVGNLSPFSSLRMSDIESIQVLKDADATAIYGSRGANGVILISTKKGKQGKTSLSVNLYQGAGKVSRVLNLMNTDEYLTMRRAAFKQDGTSPGNRDYDLNGAWDTTRSTDWQRVLIGGTAKVTDAQASLSGGSKNTQFMFTGGYRKESTVFPGDFQDRKGSAHLSVTHRSEEERFRANVTVSFLSDKNQMPTTDFTGAIYLAPDAPAIYNPDGSYNWQKNTWENPLWPVTQTNTALTENLNASTNLEYSILPGLKVSATLGYNNIRLESVNINPTTDNPDLTQYPSQRRNFFGNKQIKSWILEPQISYSFKWLGGQVEALIGSTFQQNDSHGISQIATGFNSNEEIVNVAAASTIRVKSILDSRYRYNALYARLGYNLLDKYVVNLTARKDASSRFGPGRQVGNFGAVGAAWIFSKENCIKDALPFLSFGKIRGSYGITGNDQLGDYNYLATYSNYQYGFQGIPGLIPTQLTNVDYGWESVKKLEAGLDLGFVNNRIQLGTSVYRHRTGNQLVGYNLPSTTGFSSVTANLPAVIQNSGIEFELSTRNIQQPDFSWTTTANLSIPRNKLISFPGLASSSYASQYVIGQPLSLKFVYQYTGIDPNTGLYTFQDLDGDGKISYATDRKGTYLGQKFYGGLTNTFQYKGFELNFLITFVKQNGFDALPLSAPGNYIFTGSNQKADALQGLQNNQIQKLTSSIASDATAQYNLYLSSNGPIVDASYIRLKNVTFSYSVPEKFCKVLKLYRSRVFLQGQNLITLTRFKGLDPETILYAPTTLTLPTLRIFTAGIEVTF